MLLDTDDALKCLVYLKLTYNMQLIHKKLIQRYNMQLISLATQFQKCNIFLRTLPEKINVIDIFFVIWSIEGVNYGPSYSEQKVFRWRDLYHICIFFNYSSEGYRNGSIWTIGTSWLARLKYSAVKSSPEATKQPQIITLPMFVRIMFCFF